MGRVFAIIGTIAIGCLTSHCDVYAQEARFVAMNLAGHPDDEDGATMHYYRRAQNVEVHSVIFTRGEGGQNEIGPDLYAALGAIRTRETESAARHLGTQVHFLNFYDFGFSKEAEETFAAWGGRDHVTASLVYLIRRLKPDVIFTNHDTVTVGPSRQHGHHQAVGLAAWDAFELAADSNYHPEQLEENGIDLWQPKRLFLRYWTEPPSFDSVVPIGELNAATGKSYAREAAEALRFHASQGMGQFAMRLSNRKANFFRLLRGKPVPSRADLFAGLVPEDRPTSPTTYLIDSGRIPAGIPPQPDRVVAVPGQFVTLTWPTTATEGLTGHLSGLIDTTIALSVEGATHMLLQVPQDALPTQPAKVYQYLRTASHPPLIYEVKSAGELKFAGYVDLEIAPEVHVEPVNSTIRLSAGTNLLDLAGKTYNATLDSVKVIVSVSSCSDFGDPVDSTWVRIAAHDLQEGVQIPVEMPSDPAPGDYDIRILAGSAKELRVQGRVFDAKVAPELSVGVVTSYDDTLPIALDELGVRYVLLDSSALATSAFENLHTILIDIRAYLVRADLRRHNSNLLEWVHSGGHLVVNYHKTMEWNSADSQRSWAPYPLELGRDRVTREDAPVTIQHPVLTSYPNRILPEAWDGWVQERGLYFPNRWDALYEEIFCMADPREEEHCGSTLLATYGEGTYLYSALVWYRQLKVYHPGAYRLFANMISLPLIPNAE